MLIIEIYEEGNETEVYRESFTSYDEGKYPFELTEEDKRIINISEIVGSLDVCVPNVDYIRVLWYVYDTNVVTIDNKFFGYVIFK